MPTFSTFPTEIRQKILSEVIINPHDVAPTSDFFDCICNRPPQYSRSLKRGYIDPFPYLGLATNWDHEWDVAKNDLVLPLLLVSNAFKADVETILGHLKEKNKERKGQRAVQADSPPSLHVMAREQLVVTWLKAPRAATKQLNELILRLCMLDLAGADPDHHTLLPECKLCKNPNPKC